MQTKLYKFTKALAFFNLGAFLISIMAMVFAYQQISLVGLACVIGVLYTVEGILVAKLKGWIK